jgi:hypothetical protein
MRLQDVRIVLKAATGLCVFALVYVGGSAPILATVLYPVNRATLTLGWHLSS